MADGAGLVAPAPPGEWRGGRVIARAECLLAPNPSPMTLEGTNTWLLAAPDSTRCVVIDPGPDDPAHRADIVRRVGEQGRDVDLILLTHAHADHAAGAVSLADRTGAPIRAIGTGADDLGDGDHIQAAGLDLIVVATPGHTGDSTSFLLAEDAALLTGDTILGWGTTVLAWPDGRLGDYLASLDRIASLAGSGRAVTLWPGHGSIVADAASTVQAYHEHRAERLAQVAQAVAEVGPDPDAVTARVYGRLAEAATAPVMAAARLSVLAQLDHLQGWSEAERARYLAG